MAIYSGFTQLENGDLPQFFVNVYQRVDGTYVETILKIYEKNMGTYGGNIWKVYAKYGTYVETI